MTLDASLSSSQGELQGLLDERGDKIGIAKKDWTRRIRHSEVLHRAMYPNAHGNGIKKKKKKSGIRVMNRQSQDDFVPGRGIMLQLDPYIFFSSPTCHVIIM